MKKDKGQTINYKTLHRKLTIEQHDPHNYFSYIMEASYYTEYPEKNTDLSEVTDKS